MDTLLESSALHGGLGYDDSGLDWIGVRGCGHRLDCCLFSRDQGSRIWGASVIGCKQLGSGMGYEDSGLESDVIG